MFDDKKIILNILRSLKTDNKKVNLFLNKLSEDIIQRLEIEKKSNYNILEILAKNNIFTKLLEKKDFNSNVSQTYYSKELKLNSNDPIIHDNQLSNVKNKKFDCCISFFPAFIHSELDLILKSIHRVLKKNGKFLLLFFSPDSCLKLKSIFNDTFEIEGKNMFMSSPDILLLGNLTNLKGFKNVVVDKSNYLITNNSPKDVWSFIRAIGESNYIKNRNKIAVSKLKYSKLSETIKCLLTKNKKITNEVSINYLIGTKKN